MKKILCLFVCFLSLSAFSQSGIYHPFPESNARWNINYYLYCFWAGEVNENYTIELSNDTVINFVTYHTLKSFYVESLSTGPCSSSGGQAYIYKGAIRQDTSLRKVFIVPPDSSTEELLYDFNLAVGDTVRGYLEYNSVGTNSDVVISIDSVLVGAEYRKQWTINYGYNIRIIEGVGSTFGLVEMSPQNIVDAAGYSLLCFSENGLGLYPDTNVACNLIDEIENADDQQVSFSIFPSPFHNEFHISVSGNETFEIELYDLTSRKVFKQQFKNSIFVPANGLSDGIYLYRLSGKNRIVECGKVLKD